mmetsp:Transcript_2739/g.9632  ORF Transcript_2739/g.9632 Transcript_2739/m.9632 type:complete len:296 (-) Transcript_2739:3973-4860(-)
MTEIRVHPLVLVNISDHCTRNSSRLSGTVSRQLGLLLGVQRGRTLEICNSFEAVTTRELSTEKTAFDITFLSAKQEQYKKVFPDLDVVGWYSISTHKTWDQYEDMTLHKTIMELVESPVYLSFCAASLSTGRELPVRVYESELRLVNGTPSFQFINSKYTIETAEAERISVDQVARISSSGAQVAGADQLATHFMGLHNSIGVLACLVRQICISLGHKHEERQHDQQYLREVASLLRGLPTIPGIHEDQLCCELNDSLLTMYLAALAKSSSMSSAFTDRLFSSSDQHSRRHVGKC